MPRLTKAEKELIRDMCAIADAQDRDEDGNGEGDYQEWTDAHFKRADHIAAKMRGKENDNAKS
jgi:hypothetical protein